MPNNHSYTSGSNPTGATSVPRGTTVNPYDANNHGSRVDHALMADSVTSVAWASVTGKPADFAPSAHTHPLTEVNGGNTDSKLRFIVANGSGGFGELATSPNATFIMNSAGDAVYTIKNKQIGTVDPTVNDDLWSGWSVWSRWINVSSGKEFVCVDTASGAAVWKETTAGASGSGLASTDINTIAKLNAIVGDATLDTSSATRTPTAHTHAATDITETSTKKVMTDVERTKLDGIEADATADQTAAQIKTAYEGEVNAFTDTQFTKLDGIETSATADQTGAQIKTAYQAETNAFTDAQFTKLDGIETGATEDQTDAQIETAYNNQVAIVSLVDAVSGTATVAARWTPQRVAQAIAALAGDVRHVQTKEITIEDPIATEDVAMFYSHTAITISRLTIILVGSGSPSVTVDIRHHTDRSNAGTALITTPSATTSTTGGNKITVFNNPAVGAGSFVRCKTTAQGGTVTEMMVTIEYTED